MDANKLDCPKVVALVYNLFKVLNTVELHDENSDVETAVGVKDLKEQYKLLLQMLNSAIQRGLEAKERTKEDGESVGQIMEFLDLAEMNWETLREQKESDMLREFCDLKMKSFDVDDDIPPGGVYCHSNEPGDGNFFDRQGC